VAKFLEFRLAGEEEGLAPFGAGVSVGKFLAVTLNGARVSVGKFLEVTLNGARVGVRIANVINIFLARDNNNVKFCGLPRDRRNIFGKK